MAGSHSLPLTSAAWEAALRGRLMRFGVPTLSFRLIRSDGPRAIAEIDHRLALKARVAWSAPPAGSGELPLRSHRTWGTLVGAKAWLRQPRTPPRDGSPAT